MSVLFVYPKFHATDDNEDPLSGGLLYTYLNGTTTAKTTYSDYDLATPNTNPIVLNSRGEATIYLASGGYKFVLYADADGDGNPDGAAIWTMDDINVGDIYSTYYANPDEADHGIEGSGETIYALCQDIGTSKKATIYLRHTGVADQTYYNFSTTFDASTYTNIELKFENGAQIKDDSNNPDLTLGMIIDAQPSQQIFDWENGTGTLSVSESSSEWFYPGWYYSSGDYAPAIEWCLLQGNTKLQDNKTYACTTTINWPEKQSKLIGGNPDTTIITTSASVGISVLAAGGFDTRDKLEMSDFTLKQASSAYTDTGIILDNFYNYCYRVRVQRFDVGWDLRYVELSTFEDCQGDGASDGWLLTPENSDGAGLITAVNTFIRCSGSCEDTSSGNAWHIGTATMTGPSYVKGNRFDNCSAQNCAYGFFVHGTNNIFTNIWTENTGTAVIEEDTDVSNTWDTLFLLNGSYAVGNTTHGSDIIVAGGGGSFADGSSVFNSSTSRSYGKSGSGCIISRLNNGELNYWTLEITNVGGTIQHKMYSQLYSASTPSYTSVSNQSTSLANTPSVAAGVDFTSGGGIDAGNTYKFVFDTENTMTGYEDIGMCMATIQRNDTGDSIYVWPALSNINVNGTTQKRLTLDFRDNTGATWAISTANIGVGEVVRINIFAIIR